MERYSEQWQLDVRDLQQRLIVSPTPRDRELCLVLQLAHDRTGSAVVEVLEHDPHTVGRWAAAFGEAQQGDQVLQIDQEEHK